MPFATLVAIIRDTVILVAGDKGVQFQKSSAAMGALFDQMPLVVSERHRDKGHLAVQVLLFD